MNQYNQLPFGLLSPRQYVEPTTQQGIWQGNDFQFDPAPIPQRNPQQFGAVPFVPASLAPALIRESIPQDLLDPDQGGDGAGPSDTGSASGIGGAAPASPEGTLSTGNALGAIGTGLASAFGPLGLGTAVSGLSSAATNAAVDEAFSEAYGINGQFDPMSALMSDISFGAFGEDTSNQLSANAPGINDAGFGGPGQPSPSAFGTGSHPGEISDGPSGSGDEGNGTAGMGDSPGSPSGTWHNGGMVYDGNPQTFKDNYKITAQEGEYVIPREVVDHFGVEFFDKLRADAGMGGLLSSGEKKSMKERKSRHGLLA